jgi:WS/DGAT/MGAT family acyltransferase
MRPLNGFDAMFLYVETASCHMHVAGAFVLDPTEAPGGFDFAKVREMVERRLPFAPPFRRRLVEVPFKLNHPVWIEDPNFDLDYHVRRACLPRPGGRKELADFVAQVVGLPLDRSRPLWELYLVEGLEQGRYALVTKIHHAVIDGVSGAELSANFLDLEPSPGERVAEGAPWKPERVPTDIDLVAYALASLTGRPVAAFKAARRIVETALHLNDRNKRPEVEPPPGLFTSPKTRLNQSITPHRRVAFGEVSLDDLKALKNHFGCTVNDVILALAAGGLRKYLESHDELPDDALVAAVPISVRTEDEKGTHGNKVSAMLVSLATDVGDPVARLKTIADGTRQAKDQDKAIGAEVLTGWAEFTFPALMGRAARLSSSLRVFDRVRPGFNVIVSNVPGPPFPLYLAGARLEATHPIGPIYDGVGLNITVMSYLGHVYFGLVACRETVPDVDTLPPMMEESLDELLVAMGTHRDHSSVAEAAAETIATQTHAVAPVARAAAKKRTSAARTSAAKRAATKRTAATTKEAPNGTAS